MSRRASITQAMRREVAARDGLVEGGRAATVCHWCGTRLLWTWTDKRVRLLDEQARSTPEIDHVVPLFSGGAHDADNLVPSCLSCNRRKWVFQAPASAFASASAEARGQLVLQQLSGSGVSECLALRSNPVPTRPDPSLTDPPNPSRSIALGVEIFNSASPSMPRSRAHTTRPRARAAR